MAVVILLTALDDGLRIIGGLGERFEQHTTSCVLRCYLAAVLLLNQSYVC